MTFRKATRRDVPLIIQMLADDKLGAMREEFTDPLPTLYYQAFERIERDENQELIVIEDDNAEVIGTLQLSHIPYLTFKGGIRTQIEAVRIRSDKRAQGIGEELFRWAIARAAEKGSHMVQLTTDKQRPEAKRFYERLGFVASHEGMKLHLKS